MIGKTVSHYKILEQLGQGGMGIVYKAEDTRLNRLVALKFLPSNFTSNAESKNRFFTEAQAASALDHPNICSIHQIEETDDGQIFIVMGYYEGKTLKEKIADGPIPINEALDIVLQIAEGLLNAHEKGIIHRDIKPSNIIITNEGVVKILDFGLAKIPNSEYHTKTGSTIGTVAYMAPEQVQGMKADNRSDIWSFGVLLYQVLTGKLPFKGEQDPALMWSIVYEEPEPIASLRKGVPDEFNHIIAKALEKEKEDRYQNMIEIVVDLRRLKRDTSRVSSTLTPPIAGSKKTSQKKSSKFFLIGSLVIAFMLLVLAALYFRPFTLSSNLSPTIAKPLSGLNGSEIHPAFSPDGKKIAFAWNRGGGNNYDIFVQFIGAQQVKQLTFHPGSETNPMWTRDGQSIIFHREEPEKLSLQRIPAEGGQPEELYSYKHTGNERNPYAFSTPNREDDRTIRPYKPVPHNSFALRSDEKEIIGRNRMFRNTPFRLSSLNWETGSIDILTNPPQDIYGDYLFALSPDGKTIAFTRCTMGDRGVLYTQSLQNGKPQQITFEESRINGLAWSADGKDILYSHSGENLSYLSSEGIWRVPSTGGKPQPVAGPGAHSQNPAVSLQGNLFAYCNRVRYSSLYKIDLFSNTPEVKIELSSRSDNSGSISPDGLKIAFRSTRTWKEEIWISDINGDNARAVTNATAPCNGKGSPRWSPDGRLIAFDAIVSDQGHREIFTLNPETGDIKQITSHNEYNAVPHWSRDGKWIYFRSKRNNEQQIWKVPSNGGDAIQVTQNGGYHAMESPDGKWLYFTKRGENGLWKMPVSGGAETQVMKNKIHKKNWVIMDHGIYYMILQTSSFRIDYVDLTTSKVDKIAEIEGEPEIYLDVSKDHSVLLFSKFDREESDIMLVENFR